MARITFTTMHETTMRNVQRNANKLNNLDEQIGSGRKLNKPSDNPVGFTNALNYRNILNALMQQRSNMDDGEIYMNSIDNTYKSMDSVFERCQELAVQGANDTLKHQERLFINMEVRQNIEQLLALAQTRHKDNFIFSGKWVDDPPYEMKKGEVNFFDRFPQTGIPPITNPNGYLSWQPSQLVNGVDFRDPTLPQLWPTNELNPNDPLGGNYTGPDDPAWREDNPDWTVFDPSQTVEIRLYDNGYRDPNLNQLSPYPDAQRIIPGTLEGLSSFGLLEKPEKNEDLDPSHPDYGKPDYEIDYVEGKLILLSDRAKRTFFNDDGTSKAAPNPPPPPINPHPDTFINDPDSLPKLSFEYIYKNSLDMSGEIHRELETSNVIKVNNNPNAVFGRGTPNETDAFKEIIHLMQGLWYNEQETIAEGIDTVDEARKRALAEQVTTGTRLNRVDLVYNRNLDLAINATKGDSNEESVDLADALMQFSLADAVYSASLQSAARMMRQTLMNFL